MKRVFTVLFAFLVLLTLSAEADVVTERHYLSGKGPDDAIPWNFTVTGGRRAGEHTTLPVPSQWELHGFGTYNYGETKQKGDEHGLYQTRFSLPSSWGDKRVRLIFGAVMTDTTVKVNGVLAGPTHQGGFTQFSYDITRLVKPDSENILEVEVSKISSNADTERAERGGDYWVFGGIYRAVWLEASPAQSIEQVAIDARADGTFSADITLGALRDKVRPDGPSLVAERLEAQIFDATGKPAGAPFGVDIPGGGTGRLILTGNVASPLQWTAETPHLYTVKVSRIRGSDTIHTVTSRFGFRTFEVRKEGLFLNDQRILLKGVNRHSFRPESARSLSREDCYEDVRLLRAMNMNAVRMSHYPPDKAFLEACDELGLYVLNELSGWQHAHDTAVGRLLVRELVERDVNHPSVLFWDNGNEGGWNRDLDGDFALYDPQRRPVLHPWDPFGGIDTRHYTPFHEHVRRLKGPHLVMPTEILHALYDGGGGAGLEDYWTAIEQSPFGAGAFIWNFADEGVIRTDQNNRVDVFSTYAPDGVVGPNFEKEGSYYTLRDVWSPIQISNPTLDASFDGMLTVRNAFDFTSLDQCTFQWRILSLDTEVKVLHEAIAKAPAIAPHGHGKLMLELPKAWADADALELTANGPKGESLWTWTWRTVQLKTRSEVQRKAAPATSPVAQVATEGERIRLTAAGVSAEFAASSGQLLSLQKGGIRQPLHNGPRLAFARPPSPDVTWLPWQEVNTHATDVITRQLATPQLASTIEVQLEIPTTSAFAGFCLEVSADDSSWKTLYDGTRRTVDTGRYDFPPQMVKAARLSKIRLADGTTPALKSFRIGYAEARFPKSSALNAEVKTGSIAQGPDAGVWLEAHNTAGLDRSRWTLRNDGTLRLDYAYTLEGDTVYHGVTFDHAPDEIKAFHWIGAGPTRVWQNRLRGTWFGLHSITHTGVHQPGESFRYPEIDGYFADVRQARLEMQQGSMTLLPAGSGTYFRLGTPRIGHPNTTGEFSSGDLSLLHAIPAIGSKFVTPANSGPSAAPAQAHGKYEGSVVIQLLD